MRLQIKVIEQARCDAKQVIGKINKGEQRSVVCLNDGPTNYNCAQRGGKIENLSSCIVLCSDKSI